MNQYFLNALRSIWGNKLRSLLTMLGVVIGVASVIILVSLGEGFKIEVKGMVQGFGKDVFMIFPGKIETQNATIASVNPGNYLAGDVLTMADVKAAQGIEGVEAVSPIMLISGFMRYGDKVIAPMVFGAYPEAAVAFELLKVKEGKIFASADAGFQVAITDRIAQQLFGSESAIGKTVLINRQKFEVVAVASQTEKYSFMGSDFYNVAVIPFNRAVEMQNNRASILRIIYKVKNGYNPIDIERQIHDAMLSNHQDVEDFTILSQDDFLVFVKQILNMLTLVVAALASISLIVGGIGIMNIMLVTVSERTREIGLRKAVGATKMAIMQQFLIESVVITLLGGLIGVLLAFGAAWYVHLRTSLNPVISWQLLLLSFGACALIGIVFGLWPAWRAASKDPIEALRHE